MGGETLRKMFTDSEVSRHGGTDTSGSAEYTENELLRMGADLFVERDRLAQEIALLDKSIKKLSDAFSVKSKTWGYTPLMFRNEINRRGLARS